MYRAKIPLENYVGAAWLAQQCEVSRDVIHYYAIQQRLRYFLFSGVRYLERNDAIMLAKQLAERHQKINLSGVVSAIEQYHHHSKTLPL